MSSSPFTTAPVPPNQLLLLPLLRLLLLLLLHLPPTVRCSSSVCPAGQFRFGPCIGGQCPPTCPGVCTCMGGQDCCTNQNTGGISGPTSAGGASLTRLLLAFLLGNGRSGLPALQLALCRDNALNCPLYLTYCQLPLYALCMRIHCTATCGGCGDDTLGLLLARLLFGGSTTTAPPLASAQVAIRDKMPPIRAIQKEPKSTNKSSSKCPEEKRNGTAKGENVMNSAKKAIPRPNGNWTESPSQKTTPTTATARSMLQFAIPPGLAIPRQQQQLLRAIAGRAREGSIFVREREKVAAMLRRFMGG